MIYTLFTITAMAVSLVNAATITPGNNPEPLEFNVNLDRLDTGFTVNGVANGQVVDLTSTQVLTNPSSGQARTETLSGALLTNITISLANGTFGDVIFNAFCNQGNGGASGNGGCPTTGNTLTIAANGTTNSFAITNGQNFYTVVGSELTSVALTTTGGGFTDLRQVRLSDIRNAEGQQVVPEPGTIGMMLTGLGALLIRLRRKTA